MSAYLSIIIAKEQAKYICHHTLDLLNQESNFSVLCHNKEIYWKDESMARISIEIDVYQCILESEWLQFFSKFADQYSIFRDDDSIEIAHYSSPNSKNDPFIILYIPNAMIKHDK